MFVTFIFLLSLIIKFLFIFRFSNDDWHHMWLLSWHSKKKKLDYESNNCLPEGYFAYPSLLLFLISKLRKKNRKIFAIILNYIYDIFSCLILFLISLDFNEKFSVQIDSLNFTFSLIVCLFFYSSASLSPFIARIGGVSQRPAGTLIFMLFVFTVVNSFDDFKYYHLIILIFLNILSIMISMFCSQVLFFSSLFLFLFLDFFYPFLSFILSYVIPFFVNIKVKENIIYSINLKVWYLKVLNNTSANNINFFSGIFKIFKFGNLPYVYRSQEFLVNNSIFILILFHPTLIILFFMMYNNPEILIVTNEVMIFTTLLFSCMFGFLISSFSFFKILGSPQRYLEYCLPLYVFLFSFLLKDQLDDLTIKIIILYNLFFSILILFHLKFQKFNLDINVNNDIKKIINFLNKNLKNARIFVNPFKESFIYLYYQSEGILKNNLKFYNRLISRPNEIGFKYYLDDINSGNDKNFESFYQGTSINLKKKYKITHIILDTSWFKFIPLKAQKLIKNDIKNKMVFKCNDLIIYKV